jgi:uncharacterized protein YwqG
MFTSEDQIAAALIAAGVPKTDAQQIANEAKPGIWLETKSASSEAGIAPGATKIGGWPDLPAGVDWPVRPPYPNAARTARYRKKIADPMKYWSWATPAQREEFMRDCVRRVEIAENPFPLPFVAQINFAEVWLAGPLDPDFPRDGLLSIFYDTLEEPWGYDPGDHVGSRVLFHANGTGQLTRREPPAELMRHTPFAPLSCHAHACLTPLPMATARFQSLSLAPETAGVFNEWWGENDHMYATEGGSDWKCHRVGGWPTPIQGDMQKECALVAAGYYCGNAGAYDAPETEVVRAGAGEWLLLAQIGTDEKAQMTWGDSGQIYVWIRREDLAARRFEAARLIQQCY